jgi:hypothetical protein
MCFALVLTLPNFDEPFKIETDACDKGVGAVLSQAGHPVAVFSKALSVNNQKLSTYEKFLAVLMVVAKWRHYLLRKPFVIRTDHKSLSTGIQRKAMSKLAGLQFTLQYKRGPKNGAADALSRVAQQYQINAISGVIPVRVQEILNSYSVDVDAQQLLHELAVVQANDQGFSLQDGLIRFKGKIWVGANTAIQTKSIQAFHSSAMGRHSGIQATYKKVHTLFYWKSLKTSVESFVQ